MDLTIWPVLALLAALAAGAVLLTQVVRRRGASADAGPGRTEGVPATPRLAPALAPAPAPVTPEEDALARHRRYAVEALERHAGGQPLCRVGPGSPGGLKESEGAVAALTQVARDHRAHPEDDLRATVARVRQAWADELGQRDGEHWHAYRQGGDRALGALADDLDGPDER